MPTGRRADALPAVLVVDDDTGLRDGLARVLGDRYAVTPVPGGSAALGALRERRFACAIVDLLMPGMDGVALLRRIAACAPDTVRIVLSGHIDLARVLSCVNDGDAFRVLCKPCPPEAILKAVGDAVEQHRMVIGDRELNAARVRDLSEKLVESERRAVLGTMASAVGHELRNIHAALVMTQAIVREAAALGEPPDDDMLDCLSRVASHLEAHATHLHRLGCPERSDPEVIDLGIEVCAITEAFQKLGMLSGVELRTEIPNGVAHVRVPRVRLEQILMNLVKNAKDAMADLEHGPALTISVTPMAAQRRVALAVQDNGVGMPPETLAEVFNPYFTTKAPGKGTGLGLPVIKSIMEACHGEVMATSEVGRGTCFTCYFPMATGESDAGGLV